MVDREPALRQALLTALAKEVRRLTDRRWIGRGVRGAKAEQVVRETTGQIEEVRDRRIVG